MSTQVDPSLEFPAVGDKLYQGLGSPTDSTSCFDCIEIKGEGDRSSSAGSSDLDDAQVRQMPAEHNLSEMAPVGQRLLSYNECLSPRQQKGKRYFGGYLLHRRVMAGGLLKSWKRKYFRLRGHGLVCYRSQDATEPLFEVNFTANSRLGHDKVSGDLGCSTGQEGDSSRGSSEKQTGTSRTASSLGALGLVIENVEVVGRQTPAKTVEVPVLLKAESEAELTPWTECLGFAIEKVKRTLVEERQNDDSDIDMVSPTLKLPDSDDMNTTKSSRNCGDQVQVEDFDAFRAKYLLMKEIGEGSFSIVHRAVNCMTGQLCAVKCCKISSALEEEERLLHTVSHPNVVSLEGVYARDKNLHYVVMDYLKNGDLCDLLIERQRLSETEARRIIRQAAEGLAYLHRHCVVHRDIKPENILIHGNLVKIADFGLAKQLDHPLAMLNRSCGTLEYAAPELLCGRPYSLKSDIFSLGVVLYVLLFGSFPFSVESAAALQSMNHLSAGVDVRDMSCLSPANVQWRMVSPLAQDVLLKMLHPNDSERISADDLLKHSWFEDTDVSDAENGSPEDFELARIEDCEALGFAELLSQGFQVVKYGYKESTAPHSTTLTLDFMEECITWTGRHGGAPRSIKLREIQGIREGRSTNAFLSSRAKRPPPSELCLSIICSWRTLDIVVDVPTQREFMVRGLRRLLPPSLSN